LRECGGRVVAGLGLLLLALALSLCLLLSVELSGILPHDLDLGIPKVFEIRLSLNHRLVKVCLETRDGRSRLQR
jgi:hypothetical protein